MQTFLEFEKPIAELERRVAELRELASSGSINIEAEVERLVAKSA
jgi:acetyl-CoA carboxylase carboxyl transferase subunit alpha